MPTSFTQLKIWQNSHKLMLKIYEESLKFPKQEEYNLISQIRRAALSVPTNIAESQGRYHDPETIHFIYNARGSAEEVRSLLIAARDLKYMDKAMYKELEESYFGLLIGLNSFIKSIRGKDK